MTLNTAMRQTHRWASIVFTLAVIANIIAMITMGQSQSPVAMAIGFSALVPLMVMLPTGLYLFALPYLAKRRQSAA